MPLFDRLVVTAKSRVIHGRTRQASRCVSTIVKNNADSGVSSEPPIRKSVFVSQSTDVFTNLAWEDWLYRHYDFTNHHVLLLWRNDPCVVYGRHQNPWKECNVQTAKRRGITLVRRNSGGGTVYHDNGNLNLSFFTPRARYNRKYNLHIITRALFREWRLESVVNKRDDIVVEGNYKVSGTAAKLGRPNAYHHCTLLVGVDKNSLRLALERKEDDIVTNATISIRSPIKNLIDVNADIEMDKLITVIGEEYLRTKALVLEDEERELSQQEMELQFIDPTERLYTGLDKLTSEFRSWDWNFGRTPKFTVTRTLEATGHDGKVQRLNFNVEVQNGVVEEVKMNPPGGSTMVDFGEDVSVIAANFCGAKYSHEIIENIIAAISCKAIAPRTRIEDESNVIVTQ
ncbi:PREDICTED: lipoyltransferase 1, mitochondrial-like [Dinoponera quadriceps]|uniref:Lipoyltransferase 1, mitochondrial-like n=1 Tax=Dinoponera quadriceps TaxID=609295 RepID=A0A6P3XL70_DINQU|nr:PREDICTED: lipoyltransferase 1, mitochondrial-like [Dinoponera quadriceps]XP_014478715.1 PREDICTED: lipoyltransferase 1, mitochondrial-like [Dinoponera quadriceps]XP_014478716.1 PREDICTED: lipoyltransferase 1, mitochondrial-like [Dinoponera quadriceps]XP_014478717.1 PREDICTED: lipoyltransferase 1, mitochondrial-like [Dinoponera quadriceps]XP_014478718.1 PREDICTED: lipoyltransferase 1, mitochondrial-like [Dinoponera quadriceps]XP_014478719.1 PREDICTED: lipoyltransferase 1, mitochondrial-like